MNESEQVYIFKNEIYHSLLAEINNDPATYSDAIKSDDKELWLLAIQDELDSLEKNEV